MIIFLGDKKLGDNGVGDNGLGDSWLGDNGNRPISVVVCVHWVVIDKKETLESKVPKVFLLLVVLSAKTMEWKAHFLP